MAASSEHHLMTDVDVTRLPADGATLATSLSGGLVLVAHTGRAHLGAPVDRSLLRGLARAQGTADRAFYGTWARDQDLGCAVPGVVGTEGDTGLAQAALPEVIAFRRATSHAFSVVGTDIHLVLHAAQDSVGPEVDVELRMGRPLLARLARHQHRLHHRTRVAALAAFVVALLAFVVLVALVA